MHCKTKSSLIRRIKISLSNWFTVYTSTCKFTDGSNTRHIPRKKTRSDMNQEVDNHACCTSYPWSAHRSRMHSETDNRVFLNPSYSNHKSWQLLSTTVREAVEQLTRVNTCRLLETLLSLLTPTTVLTHGTV